MLICSPLPNKVGLYVSLIVMGTAINASLPLYYETCIEATFPVAESVTMATITALYNILPITFLLIFLIPNIGKTFSVFPTLNKEGTKTQQDVMIRIFKLYVD